MSKEKVVPSEFNAKINRVKGLSGRKVSDFVKFKWYSYLKHFSIMAGIEEYNSI